MRIDNSKLCSPVRDQLTKPYCQSFALSALIEILFAKITNAKIDVDPVTLYHKPNTDTNYGGYGWEEHYINLEKAEYPDNEYIDYLVEEISNLLEWYGAVGVTIDDNMIEKVNDIWSGGYATHYLAIVGIDTGKQEIKIRNSRGLVSTDENSRFDKDGWYEKGYHYIDYKNAGRYFAKLIYVTEAEGESWKEIYDSKNKSEWTDAESKEG